MKQTAKKMIAVYLTLAGLAVEAESPSAKAEEDAIVQKYRIEYQNSHTLKKRLLSQFGSIEGFDGAGIERLKKRFDISDEIMRSVAMEIYTESLAAVKEKRTDGVDGGLNTYRQQVAGALFCLGLSADQSTKHLLIAIVTDSATESSFRRQAILSYLRAANPEEAKNVLLRFLVEGDRMDSQERSTICDYARMVFNDANPEKKEAILSALFVALSREDNKWLFRVYDDILCKISKQYANSHQRLAILRRLINAPSLCKADDYAMPELQEKLKVLQKMRLYANINTNLTTLKGRDFNLPLPVSATNEVIETVLGSPDTDAGVENMQSKKTNSIGVLSLVGGATALILGLGLWHFSRKR